jgi:hypothetical protein
MRFHDSLSRLLRIWRRSVLAAMGFFAVPILVSIFLPHGVVHYELDGAHPQWFFIDALIKFEVWLILTGQICCLASAVIAIATGVTYLMGKKLPDYTDIVTLP